MSKQTAVEWLVGKLEFDVTVSNDDIKNVIEQAKAMEREQIEVAYYDGTDLSSMFTTQSEYYEQTYGKEPSHEG